MKNLSALLALGSILLSVACDTDINRRLRGDGGGTARVGEITITPDSGSYPSEITVRMSTVTEGASIHYTLDGSEPTEESTLYEGPFQLSQSASLRARGFLADLLPSIVAAREYTIANQVLPVTVSPPSGDYTSPLIVTMSCGTQLAAIYYTVDGSEPTEGSTPYSAPLSLTADTTIKAKAFKAGMTPSATTQRDYAISGSGNDVDDVTISPADGTYPSPLAVTMSTETEGATIYYTLDGTDPTEGSLFYSAPLSLTADTTVRARAFKSGMNPSPVAQRDYVITSGGGQVADVSITPDSGNYSSPLVVTMSTTTDDASIYYTTDGTDPTEGSTLYSTSFQLTASATVKARAYKSGMEPSNVTQRDYTVTGGGGVVADVTINPPSGTYPSPISVTMSTTTAGATIYYTTNGSDPTESSTPYAGSFPITTNKTVKAKAFKTGMTPSGVTTRTYVALPTEIRIALVEVALTIDNFDKLRITEGEMSLIHVAGNEATDPYVKVTHDGMSTVTNPWPLDPYEAEPGITCNWSGNNCVSNPLSLGLTGLVEGAPSNIVPGSVLINHGRGTVTVVNGMVEIKDPPSGPSYYWFQFQYSYTALVN